MYYYIVGYKPDGELAFSSCLSYDCSAVRLFGTLLQCKVVFSADPDCFILRH
jgi:hypothetical protein